MSHRYVLIRVGGFRRFSTRPRLVAGEADLDLLKSVGRAVEQANLGAPKSVLFQGRPTMDLLLFASEPQATAQTLRVLLREWPVQVAALGRYGDLSYVRHMWRHL